MANVCAVVKSARAVVKSARRADFDKNNQMVHLLDRCDECMNNKCTLLVEQLAHSWTCKSEH